MQVVRVFNNNAVLAQTDTGDKCVLMGKGLGWKKGLGDEVDMAQVTQRFVPDGAHTLPQLASFIADVPLEIVLVAQKATHLLTTRTHTPGSQALLLAVADHLNGMRHRLGHDDGEHPLVWEVAQLYPTELAAGHEAIALVTTELGWQPPPGEAVAFALHLVNAASGDGGIERTVTMTRRIRRILDVVAAVLEKPLDHESMNVARFVTHLRYLLVRITDNTQIEDGLAASVCTGVLDTLPRALRAAERIRGLFELDGDRLTPDEVAYLALHIARLDSATPTPPTAAAQG